MSFSLSGLAGSKAVLTIFTVLKTAKDILDDDALMNALFESEELSDEDKAAIREMRGNLHNEWESLAPKDQGE